MKWDEWVGDYGLVRDLIAETYPDEFHDFNARMLTPGGFYRGNAARERIWKTKSGKAEFTVPGTLSSIGFDDAPGRYRLRYFGDATDAAGHLSSFIGETAPFEVDA